MLSRMVRSSARSSGSSTVSSACATAPGTSRAARCCARSAIASFCSWKKRWAIVSAPVTTSWPAPVNHCDTLVRRISLPLMSTSTAGMMLMASSAPTSLVRNLANGAARRCSTQSLSRLRASTKTRATSSARFDREQRRQQDVVDQLRLDLRRPARQPEQAGHDRDQQRGQRREDARIVEQPAPGRGSGQRRRAYRRSPEHGGVT